MKKINTFLSIVFCLFLLTAGPKEAIQAKRSVPAPLPAVTSEPLGLDGSGNSEVPPGAENYLLTQFDPQVVSGVIS